MKVTGYRVLDWNEADTYKGKLPHTYDAIKENLIPELPQNNNRDMYMRMKLMLKMWLCLEKRPPSGERKNQAKRNMRDYANY